MKRATILTGFALLALVSAATPAHAEDFTIRGHGCSFASVPDPRPGDDRQVGEISGGPMVVLDEAGLPVEAELYCTIQVDGPLHSDPDAVRTEAEGFGVVALAPTAIAYYLPPTSRVYLCTELWVYKGGHKTLWRTADGWAATDSAPCDSSSLVDLGDRA